MSAPTFACILMGGPQFFISVGRELIRFEDHPRLGPCPLTKTGKERVLPPRHRFWHAVTRWYAEGKPLNERGEAAWTEEPNPLVGMFHVRRRDYFYDELPGSHSTALCSRETCGKPATKPSEPPEGAKP
jgi:hypothetical protein